MNYMTGGTMKYKYDGIKMDSGGQLFAIFKCPIGMLMYDHDGLKSVMDRDKPSADRLEDAHVALADLKRSKNFVF